MTVMATTSRRAKATESSRRAATMATTGRSRDSTLQASQVTTSTQELLRTNTNTTKGRSSRQALTKKVRIEKISLKVLFMEISFRI